ncbi:MAG: hypothetical protein ACOYMG_05235 [Candidatus Methylumidiphilus sp.]
MTHLFGYMNGCQGVPSDGIRNGLAAEFKEWRGNRRGGQGRPVRAPPEDSVGQRLFPVARLTRLTVNR